MISKGKVLVAMSGGVDSTMTAYLLREQGYEIIGMTMKTWDYASSGGKGKETGCCSLDSINDARAIAVQYDFPHIIVDMRAEFGDKVIEDFVDEYANARTPNPCILCNTHMKWGVLWNKAKQLGCDFIATGHYANIIKHPNGRLGIGVAEDLSKDQSYVLWGLKQEILARTLFPLGNLLKSDVREKAKSLGWDLYNKPDSYEICFIPDNDYRGFIKRKRPDLIKHGYIKTLNGTVVAEHDGLFNFTIGQRKGLGVTEGIPLYVTKLDPTTNTVWVGEDKDLITSTAFVRDINWHSVDGLPLTPCEREVVVRVRHLHKGVKALIKDIGAGIIEVKFLGEVKAITPGQSAVFYEGKNVLGGGWLC